MTQPTQPQTTEQMTEWLYGRAEEIFLLCCLINRRGLAHAFCDLSGHVNALDSRVKPLDAIYRAGEATAPINSLRVDMESFSIRDPAGCYGFDACLQKMEGYIDWLEAVVEKGEALVTEDQAA